MATGPINSISIGQMTKLEQVTDTAVVPVVVGGRNYKTTAGDIANLVTKERLDLGNVQNLAPFEMPVSREQQAALDGKLGKTEQIPMEQVTGLSNALADKYSRQEAIPIAGVSGLQGRLNELESGRIQASRLDGLDPIVNNIIDQRTDLKPTVVQGEHVW